MTRIATVAVIAAASLVSIGCTHNVSTGSSCCHKDNTQTVAAESKAVYASFGAAVNPTGAATPASKVLGDLKSYEGKPVRVSGTVSKVCERKGCWMQMADGDKNLFVKFTCPIDGRLIPTEAVGKQAIVEGQLAIKEISEDDARHIAEEAGKTPAEVNKIVGPQKQVTLNSPGAVVFGVTK